MNKVNFLSPLITNDTELKEIPAEKSLQKITGTKNIRLTPTCTAALELSSILLEINTDDEVIVPSFTLSATINPFLLRGAKIVFADCSKYSPNISPKSIEKLITRKTKAIVVVHYAGISCDLNAISKLATEHNILLIEDAAHCIGAYFEGKHLGTIGDVGTVSFHKTKNLHCYEGGCIILKTSELTKKTEIISNMGTNRDDYINGQSSRYDWISLGSSFKLSQLQKDFLSKQLQMIKTVTHKRKRLFNRYVEKLSTINKNRFDLPFVPEYSEHNAHIFYIKCVSKKERDKLLEYLNNKGVQAVKHYEALHTTFFGRKIFNQKEEPIHSIQWSERIVRLPLHFYMSEADVDKVCLELSNFINK